MIKCSITTQTKLDLGAGWFARIKVLNFPKSAKFLGVNHGFLIYGFVRFTGGWRLETIKVYGHPIRL